ncbi:MULTISPECIES: LysR family transcriptional regulator [unclassified Variovorax]|uniref:LysR family transcriptional regulator n=1 Tax=unclassified Variovorax TaxID=663243 RepID=UPI001BD39887|nr:MULTISPECIES: LysR family transcriptional regulator [unclassified Variovorax]
MTMQQLRALVAVVTHGSIRAAARRLHLSQSAVTKAMHLLEEDAGVPLLIRGSRGIHLTEAGERLLARARLVTRQVDLAYEELRQAGGDDAGTLQVALNPIVTLTALGDAFRWFRQRYQKVDIEFSDGLIQRVLPRLRDGTLDLALVAADAGELQGDEFRIEHLRRIRQRVVVRRGHPALAAPTPQALVECEWIYTRRLDEARQSRMTEMFGRSGVEPPKRHLICDALQAFALQRNSDAVSLMPEPLLGNAETRDIVAIEDCRIDPFDLELAMLTRADTPLTPAAAFFAHCIARTTGAQPPASA